MKTKQEVIKEAYGNHWKTVSENINKNGWITAIDDEPIFVPSIGELEEHPKEFWFRPISLKGIENNNGWRKPKEYIEVVQNSPCWVYTDYNHIYTYETYISYFSICETQKITHYKPIERPKPPIY